MFGVYVGGDWVFVVSGGFCWLGGIGFMEGGFDCL